MKLADRIFDIVFAACLAIAIAATATLAGCGGVKLANLDAVPRAQYSRTVTDATGAKCQAWLPLVVRAEVGQAYLRTALEASQPWADALGFAPLVPAKDGEDATLTISVEPCPDKAPVKLGSCSLLAQTVQYCDGAVYRQNVQLFIVGDALQEFYTLMHELGHALGAYGDVGHSADPTSIMFPELGSQTALMSFKAEDSGPDAPVSHDPPQYVRPADGASVRSAWGLAAR